MANKKQTEKVGQNVSVIVKHSSVCLCPIQRLRTEDACILQPECLTVHFVIFCGLSKIWIFVKQNKTKPNFWKQFLGEK